jgi:hypothetical protein
MQRSGGLQMPGERIIHHSTTGSMHRRVLRSRPRYFYVQVGSGTMDFIEMVTPFDCGEVQLVHNRMRDHQGKTDHKPRSIY